MNVIIAGGGTGGHIFPALSIADEIKNRSGDNRVLFIGTSRGLEKDLIQNRGFDIRYIRSTGIVGKGLFAKLKAVVNAIFGLKDALIIIRSFRPDVVIGVGGYVSGPVVLAAKLMSIPTAICEQNSIPGLTNRILSRLADRIFATFEESFEYFNSDKTVVTGNPLRKEIFREQYQRDDKDDTITILITGGSQGASKLNRVIPEALTKLDNKKIRIIHQTGKNDLSRVRELYENNGLEAEVFPFINDITGAYNRADLVISRAGAGTISELAVLGKPSILIPYPYAAHNHQYLNASHMEKGGASVIIEEKELDNIIFSEIIDKILNKERLDDMSKCALKLAKPNAAQHIVDVIVKMA